MSIAVRSYKYPDDFELVGEFLVKTYQVEGRHRNWLQPRWEYMHYHPLLDESSLDKIGIWEDAGEIVGIKIMKTIRYFQYTRKRPDRILIKDDWIEFVINNPVKVEVQSDGRIRKWAKITEVNKYLRVILLDDGETVHNAFLIELSRRNKG